MAGKPRKTYSDELKKKVVSHYVENSTNMSEVAAQFGVTTGMLYKWHKRFGEIVTADDSCLVTEVRRLARELEKTKNDVDTLRMIVRNKIVEQAMPGVDKDQLKILLQRYHRPKENGN